MFFIIILMERTSKSRYGKKLNTEKSLKSARPLFSWSVNKRDILGCEISNYDVKTIKNEGKSPKTVKIVAVKQ